MIIIIWNYGIGYEIESNINLIDFQGYAMETRIYHGDISTSDFARALIASFNHGNLRAQRLGRGKKSAVQIATHRNPASGGKTALTVRLDQVATGVAEEIGEQSKKKTPLLPYQNITNHVFSSKSTLFFDKSRYTDRKPYLCLLMIKSGAP